MNYSSKDYDHHAQNWKVAQDSRGIIYVGNQAGVLEFDGVSWRVIKVPNWSVCSLAIDDTGTPYIGGKNEIGFLAPDPAGTLQYVSLLEQLNDTQRKFANVWDAFWVEDRVYFKTLSFLFRWDGKEMKVWRPEYHFNKSFNCGKKFFIHDRKVGILQMVNDSLKLVPGGEVFVDKKIYMTAQYDPKTILVGTRSNGFYLYDGTQAVPFPTGADGYVKRHRLYHGIRTSSGDFALATLLGGLVIIDSHGSLKHIIDKEAGLQDNHVNYIFEDVQGNLWLALNNGISKIEYGSPFSIYDDRSNLPGMVLSLEKHGDRLYVGTASGLFVLSSPGLFQPVQGISDMCWAILSAGKSLVVAANDGIYQVDGLTGRKIFENFSFALLRSRQEPTRIWGGTRRGLVSLRCQEGRWGLEHKFEGIPFSIRGIVEENNGDLWLGTLTEGVLKVDFLADGSIVHHVVTQYDTSHGLPPKEVNLSRAAGHTMFLTEKGIFRFDEAGQVFIPDTTLGEKFADGSRGVFRIVEDKNRHVWIHSDGRNFRAIPRPDGSYSLDSLPFLRLPIAQVNAIYPDGDTTWFGSVNNLIRYDTAVKKNCRHDFSCIIRKIQLITDKTLIYDGFRVKTNKSLKPVFPTLEYRDRNLRVQFAAPFFEVETSIRYQYFLEGYDDHWSDWSLETQKDYTNLDPGSYKFRVRAKNIYGVLSREDAFQFQVLPPWYMTWWAYSVYGLGLMLLMFLVVKWRSKYLEREKQALEQVIEERTNEIGEKKRQLEKQTIQLKDQAEKLKEVDKVKSRFFANISHEFRTPLTLIMGPLEQILSNSPNREELEKKARMMLRNSQRLLNLINQLLDLSKLESGEMKLQASLQDLVPFLKGIVASFEPAAGRNDLDLTFHAQEEIITLYFDPEKLEEVISNLLSNAVKFTPAGGKIAIRVKRNPAKEADFPSGTVDISVCDTGPGIPRDQLANIFDRFYQVESIYERHQKGSGIGLAIAKELVDLHQGKIEARRREGEGAEFIVRLPDGEAHLKANEVTDPGIPLGVKPGVPVDIEPETIEAAGCETETAERDIILVVEDNADVREYMRGALEPLYSVIEAKEGGEGIQRAQEFIPDLIISDIMMPGINGYELCRILKNDVNTSHIPIILLTAKAGEENIIEGLETGADDYIIKPFNTKILCARIKNLIDIRSQLQQNIKREMTLQPVKTSVLGIDREFLDDLLGVIDQNISDPEFNVDDLSRKLYMGRTTLYRKTQALSGETPKEFIRSYRLKRGAELLKRKSGTVLEVAFEVGFSSSSYFAKCFKERFHQLPSEYQTSEVS